MKKIKIKFISFWKNFDYKNFYLYQLLNELYDVEVTDNPDYIICSLFDNKYEYCKYPQPRIMYSGENYIPDLNLVDYAISSYPIDFGDRTISIPGEKLLECIKLENRKEFTKNDLDQKQYFANFISAHDSDTGFRSELFKKLSKYKRIEAPGTFLNNMPNHETVSYLNETKKEFQSKCKFTICVESTCHYGFITEKIIDAFNSNTIPIYLGSPTVSGIFNSDSFINCNDFTNIDDLIARIIQIDSNDEEYLKIINTPPLKHPTYFSDKKNELQSFLKNIFDQDLEKCFRRSRVYSAKAYNDILASVNTGNKSSNELYKDYLSTKKIEKKDFLSMYKKLRKDHNIFYMSLWYIKNILFRQNGK